MPKPDETKKRRRNKMKEEEEEKKKKKLVFSTISMQIREENLFRIEHARYFSILATQDSFCTSSGFKGNILTRAFDRAEVGQNLFHSSFFFYYDYFWCWTVINTL